MARCLGGGPSILSGGIVRPEGRTAVHARHLVATACNPVGLFDSGKASCRIARNWRICRKRLQGRSGMADCHKALTGELCGLAVAGEAAEWICVLPSGAESVDRIWMPGKRRAKGACADGWQDVRRKCAACGQEPGLAVRKTQVMYESRMTERLK